MPAGPMNVPTGQPGRDGIEKKEDLQILPDPDRINLAFDVMNSRDQNVTRENYDLNDHAEQTPVLSRRVVAIQAGVDATEFNRWETDRNWAELATDAQELHRLFTENSDIFTESAQAWINQNKSALEAYIANPPMNREELISLNNGGDLFEDGGFMNLLLCFQRAKALQDGFGDADQIKFEIDLVQGSSVHNVEERFSAVTEVKDLWNTTSSTTIKQKDEELDYGQHKKNLPEDTRTPQRPYPSVAKPVGEQVGIQTGTDIRGGTGSGAGEVVGGADAVDDKQPRDSILSRIANWIPGREKAQTIQTNSSNVNMNEPKPDPPPQASFQPSAPVAPPSNGDPNASLDAEKG